MTQKSHICQVKHYFDLVAFSVDVLFRLCVCLWAICNSCCFADHGFSHGDLETDVDHAQDEMVVPSISIAAHFTHYNQLYPHKQCSELANQHICSETSSHVLCLHDLPHSPTPKSEDNSYKIT